MPAYVVVHLAPSRGAESARDERAVLARRDVKQLLSEHGGTLMVTALPMATAADPSAPATVMVPDMARADKLAAALRGLQGIETAYAKPGEELP